MESEEAVRQLMSGRLCSLSPILATLTPISRRLWVATALMLPLGALAHIHTYSGRRWEGRWEERWLEGGEAGGATAHCLWTNPLLAFWSFHCGLSLDFLPQPPGPPPPPPPPPPQPGRVQRQGPGVRQSEHPPRRRVGWTRRC